MKYCIIKGLIFAFAFFIAFLSCPPAMAAPEAKVSEESQALSEFLDDFFARKMSEYHVPGAAIVMIKDGRVLFSKGYGYADIEKKYPLIPGKQYFGWLPYLKFLQLQASCSWKKQDRSISTRTLTAI